MKIIDCVQGEPEWYAARLGLLTASEFKVPLIEKGPRGGESAMRKTLLHKLAGERLTGDPMETFVSPDMLRGKAMEDEARDLYAFMHDVDPERVGFIMRDAGDAGCSPDSLIGSDGGLEIKSAAAHIQIERLLKGVLPSEHEAQVQGSMWVAERSWWDFVSYCPKLPLFVVRVQRDEEYIAKLASEVARFNDELAAMVERIRRFGMERKAA